MRTFLIALGITVLAFSSAYAEPAKPSSQQDGGDSSAEVDYTWTGKVDYITPQKGEIVVDDMMFIYSTTTPITKKGAKAPLSPTELRPGIRVKVTPVLPIPEWEIRRAASIEILQ